MLLQHRGRRWRLLRLGLLLLGFGQACHHGEDGQIQADVREARGGRRVAFLRQVRVNMAQERPLALGQGGELREWHHAQRDGAAPEELQLRPDLVFGSSSQGRRATAQGLPKEVHQGIGEWPGERLEVNSRRNLAIGRRVREERGELPDRVAGPVLQQADGASCCVRADGGAATLRIGERHAADLHSSDTGPGQRIQVRLVQALRTHVHAPRQVDDVYDARRYVDQEKKVSVANLEGKRA
mmetsp:Transcript_43700/g.126276  ORF Transcript_43700/g.126276 Transcript_43700/m.126276 type:complete len:240 (+) Transcript_43700:206-925(+)